MRAVVPLFAVLFAMTVFAGCLSTNGAPDPVVDEPVPPSPTHPLDGTQEPDGFEPPTFRRLGAIAQGGPVYGAGEPSVWADLNGTLFVAFPGCDDGPYYLTPPLPGAETCAHGLVFRSTDDGATFERLNRSPDGRLTEDGPGANGDADVAVDAAGTVYTSNLGGGIQFHRSDDGGDTWAYVGNVVPPREDDPERLEGADRQWLAAAGPGHVIHTWMRTSPNRDVAINTTFDGGANWTGTTYYGDGIGWLGTVQFAPDGQHAYIPYTQPLTAAPAVIYGGQQFAMHVLVTDNGGQNWTDIDTGARWYSSMTGGHWSGVQMTPSLDVTGDGTVIVAWAQDEFLPTSEPPSTVTSASTILYVIASGDNGATWTEPQFITPPGIGDTPLGSSVMPWVTGGAGDRFAITFFHTDSPVDSDYAGTTWDAMALIGDGFLGDERRIAYSVIDENVHQGGICTRGGLCLLTGSDRALLDFFEADLLPDGRLIVAYPADPLTGAKTIDIRVAIQDGGTLLLERD